MYNVYCTIVRALNRQQIHEQHLTEAKSLK